MTWTATAPFNWCVYPCSREVCDNERHHVRRANERHLRAHERRVRGRALDREREHIRGGDAWVGRVCDDALCDRVRALGAHGHGEEQEGAGEVKHLHTYLEQEVAALCESLDLKSKRSAATASEIMSLRTASKLD
jgi:hypothetical protein